MRSWLAKKFLIWAIRLDCVVVIQASRIIVAHETPKKKRGRPAGRKDSVGAAPVKRKLGRPLGSKNRPKIKAEAQS